MLNAVAGTKGKRCLVLWTGTKFALKGPRPKEGMPSRLLVVCVLYACLAAASAFAPLVHAPSTARSRVALDLRASAPVSRRAVLGKTRATCLGCAMNTMMTPGR